MAKKIYLKDYARKEGLSDSLVLRSTAKTIYKSVMNDIGNIIPDDIIDCYFNEIEMCDVSFADEFIINLQKHILKISNTILRILDANEYVHENIEGALALRNKKDHAKLCLLFYSEKQYSFVGDLENNLYETFNEALKHEGITARDIAQLFGIEINSASNRLKKLFDLKLLLRRELVDENGRQHIYYLPE